jgi:Sulfotransferase family
MGNSGESKGSPGWLRRAIHPFVPSGFHDPVGLARRLLKNPDPAARFAMRAAATAPLAMPMDVLLAPLERRRYRKADAPTKPILLVCGPARSGTSLAAQLLIRNLPVAYFDNLVSVFPRSPLTARRLFGRRMNRGPIAYRSYYGRTHGWSAPNDALNLWDRWLGRDRSRVPERIGAKAGAEMSAFFGAFERESGRPVVAKNNALNASAHLVSEALPTARFICLQRSRSSLALSLYRARMDIHGAATVPYGLTTRDARRPDDAVEDICRQVLYHEQLAREQLARLGAERFVIVRYEDICGDPRGFVETAGRAFLGTIPDFEATDPTLQSFAVSYRTGDGELLASIRETFSRLGAEGELPAPDSFQPAGSARA